jgi:hypothetical protein
MVELLSNWMHDLKLQLQRNAPGCGTFHSLTEAFHTGGKSSAFVHLTTFTHKGVQSTAHTKG